MDAWICDYYDELVLEGPKYSVFFFFLYETSESACYWENREPASK